MTNDDHVDGNALGGLLAEVFGRELTDARACCDCCGTVNAFGALIAYTRAPGDVLRCPACTEVVLVAVSMPARVRVSVPGLRWMEPAAWG